MLLGAVEQRTRIDAAMLKAVLDEMAAERVYDEGRRTPVPAAESKVPVPSPGQGSIDADAIIRLLAERDAQIAELQQAVVELAGQADAAAVAAVGPEIAALTAQIGRLEAKVFDQERTIRQTLAMLIEWIEGEMEQTKAA